jgi:erythrin-vacuolar iron transport family protein
VLFGVAPPRVGPQLFADVEAPGRGAPGPSMTARRALEIALRSEEKAYRFYDEALPYVFDYDVRQLFEELRAEELQHRHYLEEKLRELPVPKTPS